MKNRFLLLIEARGEKKYYRLIFFIIEFKFTIKLNSEIESHKLIYICCGGIHSVLHLLECFQKFFLDGG